MNNKLSIRNQLDNSLRNQSGLSLFDDFFTDFWNLGWNLRRDWDYVQEPAHHFYDEDTKEEVITVQSPGFTKEDIQIEVDGAGITIEGELKDKKLKERIGHKKFSYQMRKPGIDLQSVKAQLSDGVLEIRLKTEESKFTKRIEIK